MVAGTGTGDRQAASDAGNDAGIEISTRGRLGLVRLSRPRRRNAICAAMRKSLADALPPLARDPDIYAMAIVSGAPETFCAGGDVLEMSRLAAEDPEMACRAYAFELAQCWQLECFSKPTVSLIDGDVMGNGVGITLYGTHRVAGPRYALAMPECRIGFVPDCGVAWRFARLPDHFGVYLGLTGRRIGGADALALGLVTHRVAADRFGDILDGLADADPVDDLLESLHASSDDGELDRIRSLVSRCFSAETVEEIVERLRAEAAVSARDSFARAVLDDIERASPLSLKLALRHVREAAALDLRQTLIRDYRIGSRLFTDGDFQEGVRALLIDKDGRPRWRYPTLADVGDAVVDRMLAPAAGSELVLSTRQEMQAVRA